MMFQSLMRAKLSLGIAALVTLIITAGLIYARSARSKDKRVDEAVERGGATERAAAAGETVKAVETANKAEAEVRADPAKGRALCEKYSRAPGNCK